MSAAAVTEALKKAWEILPDEGRVFCAVSGGLDSMVLLHAAVILGKETGRLPIVLHVNHALRGRESDEDEAFVERAASGYGIPFHSIRLSWLGRPSQAGCREKREAFFQEMLTLAGDRLFLAHHGDDQAETILLRLIRGTGVRGLKGMAPAAGKKLRPFLSLSRAKLVRAADEWGINWREDSSNQSTKYERNWVRLELLPILEKRRPGVARRLLELSEEVRAVAANAEMPLGFDSGKGWKLYRKSQLERLDSAGLSQLFQLSRNHSKRLQAFFSASGIYEAPGQIFELSAGIVMIRKRQAELPPMKMKAEGKTYFAESLLGKWEILLGPGEEAGSQQSLRLGDRGKKEFQRLLVPVFFRNQLPLFVQRGKAKVLLPPFSPALSGVNCQLTAAGSWWLQSIRMER